MLKSIITKVEISYRNCGAYSSEDIINIKGIKVYNINILTTMKLAAYSGRDRLRDLYDVTFLGLNYCNELNPFVIQQMREVLLYKGIGHIDYILETQEDNLIDKNTLYDSFINLWELLGLLG